MAPRVENNLNALKLFAQNWGGLISMIYKIVLFPAIGGVFYISTAYLDKTYVPKTELSQVKNEQRESFKDINSKLDVLLIREGSAVQKVADLERRVGKIEDKLDRVIVK